MSKNEEKINPNEEPKKSTVHDEVEDDFTQVLGILIKPGQRIKEGNGGIF